MEIAICDNQKEILVQVENYVRDYYNLTNSNCSIDFYSTAEEFLELNKEYDIVFMDIFMDELTGIDAIKRVEKDRVKNVIFLTTSKDFAIEAFNLGAVHYLLKPVLKQDIFNALKRCESPKADEKFFKISISSSIVAIPFSKLRYVEALNKKTIYHTEDKKLSNYVPLDTVFEQLDETQFIRAQRSFIVNMAFITDFHYDCITLDDGFKISLSRSSRSELKNQYQEYLFNMARRK